MVGRGLLHAGIIMKQGSRYLVRESVLVRHFRKETFLDSQKKSFDLLQPVFDMLRSAEQFWFQERDLSRYLGDPSLYVGDGSQEILSEGVWVRFPYHHPEAACIQGEAQGYKPGFLGICWYSLGNTMRTNVLLASNQRELGHEFSTSDVF